MRLVTPAAAVTPLVAFPGLLVFLGCFWVSTSSPALKGQPCGFPGGAVSILGYFSADVAQGWEGAAWAGGEVWHPCSPSEPGGAWSIPRRSEHPWRGLSRRSRGKARHDGGD